MIQSPAGGSASRLYPEASSRNCYFNVISL